MNTLLGSVKDRAGGTFETYGVPVIPVAADKIPLLPWRQWQTEPMTREQFDALPWGEAVNYAIVTGTKTKNGYFFCAVDVDKPVNYALLPTTMMEETPRGGRHFYYLGKNNCDGLKLHDVGVELLGLGQIVVVYHKWLNDNLPTSVNSVEAVFAELARALGKKDALQRGRLPLQQVLQPQAEGNRNRAIFDLSAALRDKGVPYETALRTALGTNATYEPPLADAEVKATVESAFTHPLATVEEAASDDEGTPDMKATLADINSQFLFKTAIDIEEIYVYNNGIYEPGEHKIKEYLERLHKQKATSHYVSEVLDHIRRSSYTNRSDFNKADAVIPVINGLLNLSTLTLEPFTPDRIFTYKLNVEYKPEAKCPQWEAFIKDVVDPEDLPALQEYLGYLLVPSMPMHKLMWFYGSGRNGKGTVARTLEALFGKENCSSLEIDDFGGDRRFRLANLFGKALNISSEPSVSKTLQTPTLKKITGEDTIDAEIKNKQKPLRFVNTAKLFIIGNRFPKVNDDSIAFWDRILFTNFPKAFLGESAIPHIEHRWTKNPEEMAGLLNWMIQGHNRLLKNNTFTASKTTEQTKLAFKRASNTTMAFIDEQCEFFPNSIETRANLYEHYKEYCESYGITIDDERVFTAKLKQLPNVGSGKRRIEGVNERVWIGLKVKPRKEEPEEHAQTESAGSGADEPYGALISPP
jgi:P4 family phage/plasmid primase-like protien